MKSYLVNSLEQDGFTVIITLLDYKTQISRCLKSIKISPCIKGKLLIDTLLCSGMNEYRFIETTLNEDGTINLDKYDYITPQDNLKNEANKIVKSKLCYLKNSVLPETQIKKIING